MITQNKLHEVLRYDSKTGVFTWRPRDWNFKFAYTRAGTHHNKGYRQITVLGEIHLEHRLAWLYTYGCWPVNDIDHINRNRADNRLANLRDVTRSVNLHNANLGKRNTTGVLGVTRRKNKYQAKLYIDGVAHFLGVFRTKRAAAYAREQAEIRFGVVKVVPHKV